MHSADRRISSSAWPLAGACLAIAAAVALIATVTGGHRATVSAPWEKDTTPATVSETAKRSTPDAESELRERVRSEHLPAIQELARSELVVDSVLAANRSNALTHDQILQRDLQWRATPGTTDPLISTYLTNPCALYLREVKLSRGDWAEVFVMDNKGCIVAESDKTSDYWQGDEDKWRQPMATGEPHIGEVVFDDSSHAYVVQVSTPILDVKGSLAGVVTVSVRPRAR